MVNANSSSARRLGLLLLAPLLVAANLSTLEPAVNGSGTLSVDSPQALAPGQWSASSWLIYAHHPLVRHYTDGSELPVIGAQLRADAIANVGLARDLDLALDLPVLLRQWQTTPLAGVDPGGTSLGDLRLMGRWAALPARVYGLGLSAALQLSLPTGSAAHLAGQGSVGLTPQALLSVPLGTAQLLARLGYTWRPNRQIEGLSQGQQLPLGLGMRLPLTGGLAHWEALAEVQGVLLLPLLSGSRWGGVELMAGARTFLTEAWELTGGLAWGLGQGLGVPMGRAMLGLAYRRPAADDDGDGLANAADACPQQAETYNGFADADGCPDQLPPVPPVPRSVAPKPAPPPLSACALDPRDWDGPLDPRGCPDLARDRDQDRDGVPEPQDLCPTQARDHQRHRRWRRLSR